MSTELLLQIKRTIEDIAGLTTIQKHYESTTEALSEAYRELDKLDRQLDKELKDVERLEELSVKSIFYQVLGSKEEELEKERQEYLQVNLKHKELKKSIELLEFEKNVLSGKVQGLADKESHLEQLKAQRETLLISANSPKGIELRAIVEGIDSLHRKMAEIDQAIKAGDAALKSLGLVTQHLKKAESWGNWDMTSQGRHYDHMKHSAIDRAIDEAYRSKHLLTIFKNELADVRPDRPNFNLVVESFNKFTDIFLDNLISDWMVQRKIKNVLKNVRDVTRKVYELIDDLKTDLGNAQQELTQLLSKRDLLLTT